MKYECIIDRYRRVTYCATRTSVLLDLWAQAPRPGRETVVCAPQPPGTRGQLRQSLRPASIRANGSFAKGAPGAASTRSRPCCVDLARRHELPLQGVAPQHMPSRRATTAFVLRDLSLTPRVQPRHVWGLRWRVPRRVQLGSRRCIIEHFILQSKEPG
jgi:hypothetical protein